MSKPISDKKRSRKAFRVAYRILISYSWITLGRRLFGKRYYEKRIAKVNERNAKRLKKALTELKGLFTKVGQLVSMMSNVLPVAYGRVLESMQDKAPASPFEDTVSILEEDLGSTKDELFEDFENEPIASASIGQVYKATLKTGEKVAVKVQHKDIKDLANADLEIIRRLIKRVSFFVKIKGLNFVYEQVKKMVLDELDFNKERLSTEIIGKNLEKIEGISVPEVYAEYSSSRIITTSFQDAVKISNLKQLDEWGIDKEALAKKLILAYCKMVLDDGFYHADPHPGNVFVKEDGEIILLDFGATAVLNEEMRKEIPILARAALQKDADKVVSSLQKMGFIGQDGGARKLATKIVETFSNFVTNEMSGKDVNMANLSFDDVKGSSVEKLMKSLSIRELSKTVQVPKDWVLLDRTLILINGISLTLAPKLDPITVVKPYLKDQFLKGGFKDMLISAAKDQINALISLPTQLDTLLKKANNGELKIGLSNDFSEFHYLGQQIVFLLALFGVIFFYQMNPQEYWIWIGSTIGVLLLRSVWVGWRRKRRKFD
jgi:ubiquinone biosynthesis protein